MQSFPLPRGGRVVLAALIGLALPGTGWAQKAPAPARVGTKIADFTLKDSTGKAWSLADLKDKKAVAIVFVGTECPVNNAYMPRLAELHKQFADKGVQLVGINANQQDSVERIAEHAKKRALPFPVLKDEGNRVADLFGAQRTPEAYVLDVTRTVRYSGRIDDQFGIGFARPKATQTELTDAVDELVAGKTVSKAHVDAPGCLIARVKTPKANATVTFSKHIAPILQNNCQECHRPNQIGPMALLTYRDAAAWSDTIKEVILENRMPPWHADPKHGTFTNDRRLAKADRDTLLSWIDQGCPEGDKKDLPPAKEFTDGWRIGKPDMVFTMNQTFKVPAETPKNGVPYQHFMVPTNFKEDMWVQAVEAKPGNPGVVHHIIVYAGVFKLGEQPFRGPDGIGQGFLVGFAPGDTPARYELGTAKKIEKGSTFVFQVHYTPNGVAGEDRSSVALIFAKEPPKVEARTRAIATRNLRIPPGEGNYKTTSTSTFDQDTVLVSLFPHMHLRGKSFEYTATYPDGKSEVLLSIPKYDFGWQTVYTLPKPMEMPAGTRIDCTAYFDNSEKNLNNPDPTKLVTWGDQTWEEMMIGFVDYAFKKK